MDNNVNNPQTNTNPMGFSSSNMDVPPIPIDPSVAQAPSSVIPAPQTPETPPSGGMPTPPPPPTSVDSSNPTIVNSGGGRGFPKKLIFIVLGVVMLLLLVVLAVKVLLPKIGGGGAQTITWWGLWETKETVQPLIDEYEASHPNVKVNYTQESKEQYRERLVNSIAQGNGPDIMTIHNSWVPMFRSYLSSIPSNVMTSQEYAQTFYPIITSDMTLGSGLVGFPTGYDGLALFVNDEIFGTYGKTAPKTWNELRDTAISLTIKDEKGVIKQSGVALGTTSNIDDWQEVLALLMLQNGANLASPTGVYAEGALNYYAIFNKSDGVWNDTLPNSTVAFANGIVAMIVAPSWRAHDIKAINPSLKFHIVSVPQLPKNSPDEPDVTYATYWVSSVSNKSNVSAAAWDFLKFVSSKESYEKLFQNEAKLRTFGQPYPRIDMRDLLSSDPYLGGIISLAGSAKSWYLAGKTWDGETGINSKIGKYFEDAVNSVNKGSGGTDTKSALSTVALGVNQVLSEYGLATPRPTPVK